VTDEEKLIAKHIEPDPHRPGADEVRTVENGVHVWAVIGDYLVADGDVSQVMKDYDLSREAVEAALDRGVGRRLSTRGDRHHPARQAVPARRDGAGVGCLHLVRLSQAE
jgi:uncharacterized protein (DUF433 family)